jgi:hypothetical protein
MNCRMQRRYLHLLSALMCSVLFVEAAFAGQAGGEIAILVLEGNKAQNLLSQRALKPISVRIVDRTGKPLSGANVQFVPPEFGAGGTFVTTQNPVTVTTNPQGVAEAPPFQANSSEGNYEIQVIASYMGDVARLLIEQSNVTSIKKKSTKKIVIISALVGGGLAAALAAKGGGDGNGGGGGNGGNGGGGSAPTITFLNTSIFTPQ